MLALVGRGVGVTRALSACGLEKGSQFVTNPRVTTLAVAQAGALGRTSSAQIAFINQISGVGGSPPSTSSTSDTHLLQRQWCSSAVAAPQRSERTSDVERASEGSSGSLLLRRRRLMREEEAEAVKQGTHAFNELPSVYQQFIHKSRYARWRDDLMRRETWSETVSRYFDFMENHLKEKHSYVLTPEDRRALERSVLSLEVMPSMRALMTAGKALARDHTCAYNCAYLPVETLRAFDETLYILMSGTGVGYSVERRYTSLLPVIAQKKKPSNSDGGERGGSQTEKCIVVEDSKMGWAVGLRELLQELYSGGSPTWDLSGLRLAGARLHTMGGRASGPESLHHLFVFASELVEANRGSRLTPLQCHDLMCKIGEVVVSGGVRRSALISLSDLSDEELRGAKSGNWWEHAGQRAMANNSVVYKSEAGGGELEGDQQTGRPNVGIFMQEWMSLYQSKSGERGIFNRVAAEKQVAQNGRRELGHEWGCNPCSEIILRPYQFCNLTEVVVRAEDDMQDLARKVEHAAVLGTFQATLVDFDYLGEEWRKNTEEERLLGVSLTGVLDHPLLSGVGPSAAAQLPAALKELRAVAVNTNHSLSGTLGVPGSAAVTCVKPSGTVSQLVDAASGVHARHAPFYVRTVRGNNKDPLTRFMKDAGVPWEADVTRPDCTSVFSFPMRAPAGAVTRKDLSALQQLQLWLTYQRHWCEHKPSVTISVREEEWMSVGAWVWEHFGEVSGISFLPFSDHTYAQAPYQDCDEVIYNKLTSELPQHFTWDGLEKYEVEDNTRPGQEFACTAGSCEIVDISN